MVQGRNLLMYDFLLVKGGAEAVSLQLCADRDEMDLGVGFVDPDNFPEAPLAPERLHSLGTPTHIPGWQTIKTALLFEQKGGFVCDYDKVVFSGSNAPLAVKHRINQRDRGSNLLYCHTPPRFVYDLKDHYLSTVPLWQNLLLRGLIAWMKPRYEKAIAQMDLVIANSRNTHNRLKKYLDVDSIVVYPPCDTSAFKWHSQGDFYLSTARLEPYKRVDLIVNAFLKMPDKQLVVASGGSQLEALKQKAAGADNIRFTGWCEWSTLKQLMGECRASVYLPMDEDFGMSPVESMAAGKPVIGVAEGGVLETVVDGKTGVLCPANPTVDDVKAAIERLDADTVLQMRPACEAHAKTFSVERFMQSMSALLDAPQDQLADVAKTVDALTANHP